MSKRQVDFSVLHNSQNIIKINSANSIIASDSNSDKLAIATDVGLPLLLDLKTESIKSFQNPKNNKYSIPTSIAINQKSNYVVTGHADGSISVFSVDENFCMITSFKGFHKQEITAIAFAPKDDSFYVGDVSGLTTKISFGKIISKSLSEKEINRDTHPVTKILFTKDEFMFQAGIIVMTNHFVLIDPTKSHKEQVTGRSGNFDITPSVIFYEGLHGNVDVYAFSGNSCHYYTLSSANFLNYSGSTVIFTNPKEFTTNAMLWNSKMIAIVTNYALTKFVNIRDISLSIERRIGKYDEFVVQRHQSPLSQAIISSSIYITASNEYLYCVQPLKVVKMNFTSWKAMVSKHVDEKDWEGAFKLIVNASKCREIDAIGLSDRISEQTLSIKQLTESVITQYLNYAIESKDEDLIERSIRDCVRMSSQVSIQKFITSEIMPIIEKAGYTKIFYSTIFQRRGGNRSNDYITPEFIKNFLTFFQKNNDLEYAEKCLMRVKIPKNYASDIASIIYEFGLIGTFSKIMVFSFQDFITPCIILKEDFNRFKTFLMFIYGDNIKAMRAHIAEKMRRKGTSKDIERMERMERIKKRREERNEQRRKEIDWDELDRQKKLHGSDDDDDHHGHHHGNGSGHDHSHGPGHDHDHGHQHDNNLGYAEEGNKDEEEPKKGRFGRESTPEEEEQKRRMKLLAQRMICLWLFCPASIIGFDRLAILIDGDLQLATTILEKCATLLPLKYAPNNELNLSYFADAVMQVLNQRTEGDDIKYEKYLPLLNIICPLYAQPEITVTRCALRLTCNWCFHCTEQPQSLRIEVINKIRSKYPTLINEEDFMNYSVAAGFRFAVEAKYLSQKRYDIIVSSMLCEPEDRSIILDFLETHISDQEEVKKALLENIEGLVLINSDSLFNFVLRNYPDLKEDIINTKLTQDLHRYLYLSSYLEFDPDNAKPHLDDLFELTCKVCPMNAIMFFQDHSSELDIDKAKDACSKYYVCDCFVTIAKVNNNQEEAIKSVERALIDTLETEGIDSINITSDAQLGQYPPLVRALNAIDALLDFQREVISKQEISEEDGFKAIKNLKFFHAFNFPFYVSRDKPTSVRKILFLLYTHFVIGSMDSIPVKILFTLLFVHVRQFDFNEIRQIMAQLSDEVEFKERLSDTLLQMSAEDTCHLLDEVFKYVTKGRKTNVNVCCSSCLKPLSPPQYGTVLVFPCGHMFHDETECWQTKDEEGNPKRPDECPICNKGDDLTETLEVQIPTTRKKLSKSQMKMLLRRLDFALKRNYGADIDDYRPSSVYFAAETRDIADDLFVPQKLEIAKAIPVRIPK